MSRGTSRCTQRQQRHKLMSVSNQAQSRRCACPSGARARALRGRCSAGTTTSCQGRQNPSNASKQATCTSRPAPQLLQQQLRARHPAPWQPRCINATAAHVHARRNRSRPCPRTSKPTTRHRSSERAPRNTPAPPPVTGSAANPCTASQPTTHPVRACSQPLPSDSAHPCRSHRPSLLCSRQPPATPTHAPPCAAASAQPGRPVITALRRHLGITSPPSLTHPRPNPYSSSSNSDGPCSAAVSRATPAAAARRLLDRKSVV